MSEMPKLTVRSSEGPASLSSPIPRHVPLLYNTAVTLREMSVPSSDTWAVALGVRERGAVSFDGRPQSDHITARRNWTLEGSNQVVSGS